MRFVVGDATQPQGEGVKIIVHVCNDVNGFGSGFAKVVANKWPVVKQAYHDWHANGANFALGMVQLVKLPDDIIVANMIAQHGYSYAGNPAIQYPALHMCLSKVAKWAKELGAIVHAPRLGCGLAGGTWSQVGPIILDAMKDVEVVVYDLPESRVVKPFVTSQLSLSNLHLPKLPIESILLGKEDFGGHWWNIYRGPSGRIVAVCEEMGIVVEGNDLADVTASALDALTILQENTE